MAKRASPRAAVSESELLRLRLILAASLFAAGCYYELLAAALALLLGLWLLTRETLRLRENMAALACFALFLGYVLSCLWASDRGLAPLGVAKYLPLPLMALCLMQLEPEQRRRCLDDLPALGALMTALSFPLQFLPFTAGVFSVAGRLGGFFLYPNSFGCFLLLGLERLLLEDADQRPARQRALFALLLLFGLIQSGSRTVFLLALVFLAWCLLLRRRSLRGLLPVGIGLLGGGLLCLPAALLAPAAAAHLAQIDPGQSTFLGRLLYAIDALPVIGRHPFGLGYLGYYMTQRSFQTGVYAVRWVHNDLLQLLLDVGWLPAGLAVAAAVRALLSRQGGALRRLPLLTLLAHCLFDFDLAFMGLFFVLLLMLDWDPGRERRWRVSAALRVIAALAAAVGLYFGAAAALYDAGAPALCLHLYPGHTLALTDTLTELPESADRKQTAGEILRLDRSSALAWEAIAQAAYAEGDFEQLIAAKREALRCAPYDLSSSVDYFEKLRVGAALYEQSGDAAGAEICRREIRAIGARLEAIRARTNRLAWLLDDKPELTMPPEYAAYLETLPEP